MGENQLNAPGRADQRRTLMTTGEGRPAADGSGAARGDRYGDAPGGPDAASPRAEAASPRAEAASPRAEAMAALLAAGAPARPALIVPDSGQVLTYAQAAAGVDVLARRLAGLGVRRGDKVALSLPNGPDIVLLLLAITALGAAAAPLNPAYTQPEFEFFLGDIAPRLTLIPASGAAAASAAAAAAGTTLLGVRESADGAPELLADGQPSGRLRDFEPGDPDDVALILHTSGTTSRPKQVPLRQRNLMASARTIAAHYELGPADVSFSVMPLFHIHGLVASTFAALGAGGAVITPRRFTPTRFWPQAREQRATWLSAGPTLHQMILDKADAGGPPESLRFVRSCSSALSPALAERAEREYRAPMLEAYGMTEASHQMASNPLPPADRIFGSVGVPTGTEVGIAGQAGDLLPAGTTGEVVIRGPGVMSGYVNNPEATAASFFGDWFRTGDRGVLRDGYLFLEGRIKEMILRGGENIAPAEIEQVLMSHPAVRDAVCFGVADDKYGELVGAAVTLTADAQARDLIDHCRGQLAAFKVPTRIDVLEEIPRTPTGKVQRRRVAEFVEQRRAGA
jgi:acyl-CoA synthetase (AMP-forming)/AMP-acid ligase II